MLRRLFLLFCFAQGLVQGAEAQEETDPRIVQINGVTITADSLRAVPFATVTVKNKYRGVSSSELGVFSLVCYKGDTLEFTAVGFRPKSYIVPQHIKGQYFSMIQLMVQDTFYLPETIVRPLPTREQFDYAFTHWQIPDDQYEVARKNTDALMLRAMAYTMPRDGRENQAVYQQGMAREAIYYGQVRPSNITNPISWAEFFEAWKRGDFRRKNY
jgi:hypothetical protein